jgi:hypothetical protein
MLTYVLEEARTSEALFVDRVLASLLPSILRLAESKVLDPAVVKLVPIFVIPGFTEGHKLMLGELQDIY